MAKAISQCEIAPREDAEPTTIWLDFVLQTSPYLIGQRDAESGEVIVQDLVLILAFIVEFKSDDWAAITHVEDALSAPSFVHRDQNAQSLVAWAYTSRLFGRRLSNFADVWELRTLRPAAHPA